MIIIFIWRVRAHSGRFRGHVSIRPCTISQAAAHRLLPVQLALVEAQRVRGARRELRLHEPGVLQDLLHLKKQRSERVSVFQ